MTRTLGLPNLARNPFGPMMWWWVHYTASLSLWNSNEFEHVYYNLPDTDTALARSWGESDRKLETVWCWKEREEAFASSPNVRLSGSRNLKILGYPAEPPYKSRLAHTCKYVRAPAHPEVYSRQQQQQIESQPKLYQHVSSAFVQLLRMGYTCSRFILCSGQPLYYFVWVSYS